ncbi:DUF262 domain-containing protein [Methanoplanus sp. FWC-SCC4]|uniref:DUF262 domain-containing protein n=1 Tax=Methanochimaera problematica TaxID=2609417 RepID=A0AA97FDE2_9EURY|nr:DUF262 domain-containing protein [Methanoplanus sp. FWC-SCC4]WOF15411.1 DUF262 domain-containing protein [Methanoplanus sp. FWC-SCC4]
MKAKETQLLKFLKIPNQYIIPLYQRTYSWSEKQCAQLWDDILRAGKDKSIKGHFIGSVVYIEKGLYNTTDIPQMLVIDGQQRLTTISLLIAALGQAIKDRDDITEISQRRLNYYYLYNIEEEGELRYKLLLTQNDKESLKKILDENKLPKNPSESIVKNFEFFKDKIENSGVDPLTIYEGLNKLIIVDIALDRENDNPQLIFESLNSTGLQLSQADLIRNYVLMGLDTKDQECLYKEFWYPMEENFHESKEEHIFDRFMRDYLIVKTGKIPRLNQVYEAFKLYTHKIGAPTVHEIISDIYKFSQYFTAMNLFNEEDEKLRKIFFDIKSLRVDVVYPFLIEVYDDYQNKIINKDEFIEILNFTENYIFRRAVCEIPTNSLNKTFAGLSRELYKNNYLDSFKSVMVGMKTYKRYPSDAEFKRELMIRDVYNFRNSWYMLRKLENFNTKESVNLENCSIEHIMPQNENLSAEWQNDLGENWEEIHEQYLHTIGNLTITGYNPELSDRPFIQKRDMEGGFGSSPIRLNRGLSAISKWDVDEIEKRANRLSDRALEVWSYPDISDQNVCNFMNSSIFVKPAFRDLYNKILESIEDLVTESSYEDGGLSIWNTKTDLYLFLRPEKNHINVYFCIPPDEIHIPEGILIEDGRDLEEGYSRTSITSTSQIPQITEIIDKYINS